MIEIFTDIILYQLTMKFHIMHNYSKLQCVILYTLNNFVLLEGFEPTKILILNQARFPFSPQ